jgi:hypothetical protein
LDYAFDKLKSLQVIDYKYFGLSWTEIEISNPGGFRQCYDEQNIARKAKNARKTAFMGVIIDTRGTFASQNQTGQSRN